MKNIVNLSASTVGYRPFLYCTSVTIILDNNGKGWNKTQMSRIRTFCDLPAPHLEQKLAEEFAYPPQELQNIFPDSRFLVLLPAKFQITCYRLVACSAFWTYLWKAPLFLRKAPLFLRKAPLSLRKTPLFLRTSSLFVRNSSLLVRKRSLFTLKSLPFLRKSPVSTEQLCICTEQFAVCTDHFAICTKELGFYESP